MLFCVPRYPSSRPSMGVGKKPRRAPYAAPVSEPLSDWL